MSFLDELDQAIAKKWNEAIEFNPFLNALKNGHPDRRLFALYLCEVYNNTRHSAITQALVVQALARPSTRSIRYMKYCLKHALEEVGHEQMALHDLRSLGVDITNESMPKPLPATERFTRYLYEVSTSGNPARRLGYTYWAENSYKYFQPVALCAVESMQLEPRNLTFFIQHGELDHEHFDEVRRIIGEVAVTEEDQKAILDVSLRTIELTEALLAGVWNGYQAYLAGEKPECGFLEQVTSA